MLLKKVIVRAVRTTATTRTIRVELQVREGAPSKQNESHLPLKIELEERLRARTYQINKPFTEERSHGPGAASTNNVSAKHALELYEVYAEMALTMKQHEIASKVKKTTAHVSQIMSLRKISPELRKRITGTSQGLRDYYSLNKLMALTKFPALVQEARINTTINAASKIAA